MHVHRGCLGGHGVSYEFEIGKIEFNPFTDCSYMCPEIKVGVQNNAKYLNSLTISSFSPDTKNIWFSHAVILTIAFVSLTATLFFVNPCTYSTVSSAYIWMWASGHRDGKSFIYKQNKSGPSMDPCGTPVDKERVSDCWLFISTFWVQFERYNSTHLSASAEKLKVDNLDKRTLWFTVSSNALRRSRKTAPTTPCLSSSDYIFSMKKRLS